MPRRLLFALFLLLSASAARAEDVQLGSATLKLDPPAGMCTLDPAQPSDKRLVDFITAALANGGIDLLGISADCDELRDWRSGKMPLLQHFSQFQTAKASRSATYTIDNAKAACTQMRAQGADLSSSSTDSVNENIHKAYKAIDFRGQQFLGVVAEDPNGCYVGLFQKYKADNGKEISQLNVFFMGSIKDRAVNFYLWEPYRESLSVTELLGRAQAHVAKVKAANKS